MKQTNKKGFTLIELLAVIVIMGILMMTAIPAMSKYIDNSRRDSYLDTAKQAIAAARLSMTNDEYKNGSNLTSLPEKDACVIIPYEFIDMDKGSATDQSPWGKTIGTSAWVLVKNTGTTVEKAVYTYYFLGTDSYGNGSKENIFKAEKTISRTDITKKNNTSKKAVLSATSYTGNDVGGCTGTVVQVDGQR